MIPITVFTGFLGAGKTTLILSLLPKLPKDYKVCLLKNEFGDVEVDSQLARQSSLAGVSEILNGCMCCVLVGQMKTALLEIKDKFNPDRIFIESSGSAFPATLAFQIRDLERETNGGFKLDAIVTVVDAENFTGYEDTSPTAKMQASYTDLIIINKWEHVSEPQLDTVLDHLHTLNDLTPKIKCDGTSGVDPNIIFGIDSKLFSVRKESLLVDGAHTDEVQTVTLWRGVSKPIHSHLCHDHAQDPCHVHATPEPRVVELSEALLRYSLDTVSKESVWRIKGFVRLANPPKTVIVNWAFGRVELTPFEDADLSGPEVRLTIMGESGEVKRAISSFSKAIGTELL